MKNRAVTLLFTLLGLCVLLSSCQSKSSKPKPVEKPVMVQNDEADVELNIHIRHFTTEKCKQGVSHWVYSQLPYDVRDHFKKESEFERHHQYRDVRNGVCDNTVQLVDEKTGKVIYRCGGHTFSRR